MSSEKMKLLVEAEKRGILPDDKVALLQEARKRGLVKDGNFSEKFERTRAFSSGIGESFPFPGAGKLTSAVSGAVTDALGIDNPYKAEKERLAAKYPTIYGVGKAAPEVARSIATFPVASNLAAAKAAKYIPSMAKGAKLIPRMAAGAARIGAKAVGDAGANVVAGQIAEPGLSKIPTDAAIGAVLGTGSGVARETAPALKRSAAKLYSSVLKRPAKRILTESKSGGKTLEASLADESMFTPTVGSLKRKAGRNVNKLSKKIKEIIEPIKMRVNPSRMVDSLKAAKKELDLVDDVGRITPGEEGSVKVIDDMIDYINKTYVRDESGKRMAHLSVKEAQKLKQVLWKKAKNVFERTETSAMKSEAQAAAGRGMKKGIEEAAESTNTGWGQKLIDANKKEGMWLEAGNAANVADARIGKTFMGRMIMPLMFGGGAAASHYGGAEGGTAPLAAAALLSTPSGRLLAGNLLSTIAKQSPKMSLMAPLFSAMIDDKK